MSSKEDKLENSRSRSWRERFNLSQWAIKYSRVTICIWLGVAVAGLLAFSSLQYALFPDVTFPVVVVNSSASGETALETELQLTQPIEQALLSLPGLENLNSVTYGGKAVINLAFGVGTDLEMSTQAVETALIQANVPPQADFQVIPLNLNESAAVSYAIKSESKSLRELTAITQQKILPALEDLPGVLKVNLLGEAFTSNGEDASSTLVRFNGENALAVEVIKDSDANTLEVVSRVNQVVEGLPSELPEVEIPLAATQANYIREATQATIDALILAVCLAVLVIFLFLRNIFATVITALAIPISLLGTCIVMAAYNFNLETITLLALALVIGIIVDDAIVDVENIMRHLEAGESPRQAALNATREIGLTVSASTLTIVAVFLPVALMGGTIGQFFKPFGLTISAAVLISLLVARTLSPALAVYWLKDQGRPRTETPSGLERNYGNLLRWSLNHRWIVVALAIVSFVAGVALIPFIPKGFIPKLDRGEFNIVYTVPLPELTSQTLPQKPVGEADKEEEEKVTPGSFSWLTDILKNPEKLVLNKSRRVATQLEEVVLAVPEVESVFTTVGIRGEPNKGRLYIKLKEDRRLDTAEIQRQLRTSLPSIEGVEVSVEDLQFIEQESTKPLKIALLGDDLALLTENAQKIQASLAKLPGLADVTATGENNQSGEITEIQRHNGQRAAFISANLQEGKALGDATQEAVAIAQSLLPEGITLDLGGDSEISSDVLGSFAGTLALSVVLMLLVLILLFGSLIEALVVGLSLPLSIVGAMVALLCTQSEFGMISLIGLILLLGLLDKNALLLMDYAKQLRRGGMDRTEAIVNTGLVRLRPILMTTASTILGMVPIALGLGAGAQLRQPMAVAIIGGLLTSTLLSLVVVPVLYTLLEDGWVRIQKSS